MLSRALSLATAMLLIGFAAPSFLIAPASAQNLEAGKSPAQLFSANCTVCHKSARGLLKSVPPGDLPGFLRQHYTTSADMAKSISTYLVANGAGGGGGRKPSDDGLTRQGRELTRERQPAPAEAAPDDRRLRPAAADRQQAQPAPDATPAEPAPRRGRKGKRQPPAEAVAPAGEAPAAAESERPAAPKLKGKKNRRHQDEPKADTAKDAPKSDAKPDTDKGEPAKSEAPPAKPAEESKPAEAVRPEPKPEPAPATRADPVPAVTPAPKEAEPATPPPAAAPAPEPAKPAE